jgi:hypothetical protein
MRLAQVWPQFYSESRMAAIITIARQLAARFS